MAKGKGTSGRSSGPWKGGPQRGKSGQQPFSPRQTKDVTERPPRRKRGDAGAQSADAGGSAAQPVGTDRDAPRRAPRSASTDEGFARAGRAQPGKPGPTQRAERPPR